MSKKIPADTPEPIVRELERIGLECVRIVGEDKARGTIYEFYADDGETPAPTGLPILASVTRKGGVSYLEVKEAFSFLARMEAETAKKSQKSF